MVPNDTWHGEFNDYDPQYEQESPVQYFPEQDKAPTDQQYAMNAALDALEAALEYIVLQSPESPLRELVIKAIDDASYELLACGADDVVRPASVQPNGICNDPTVPLERW